MRLKLFAPLCCLLLSTVSLFAQHFTATSAPTNYWDSLASSADGMTLVALETAIPLPGPSSVYVSTNSGASWTATLTISNVLWGVVACSADGRKVVAAANGVLGVVGAPMYSSSDSGMTWALNCAPLNKWDAIASSADGTRLAAAIGYPNLGGIYTSTNSGATWVQSSAPVLNWIGMASSVDGSKLVAAAANGVIYQNGQPHTNMGQIYVSTNAGMTWSVSGAPSTNWHSVASSADGTRLAAVVSPYGTSLSGPIYTSTNSGLTWTKTGAPLADWWSISSSADGRKLLAACWPGSIYTSTDGGATWTNDVSGGNWPSTASSADGSLLAATADNGRIFVSRSMPHPAMRMAGAGGNIAVSWVVPTTNFVLQSSATFGAEAGWSDVPVAPTLNLSTVEYQVVISPTNSQGFYRLESR